MKTIPVPVNPMAEAIPSVDSDRKLGDFTATRRVLPISLLAMMIGMAGAILALVLQRLIGFFTNLFFFQRIGFDLVSPAGNHLGLAVIAVPVIGGLIVGLMARYGSDKIRGHGIPEAMEAILLRGARVEPRLAILKPISSAIAIGSGGPFGAEGPIIMTGGALGSMVAQFFHLTNAERKTLLVAGAAAGMSATFAAPVSAVLLAVELLLFEWKPRSLIPVAMASAAAAGTRWYLLGAGPLFPFHVLRDFIGPQGLLSALLVGLLSGALAALLSLAVYGAEDAFHRLPIHWMWWPSIGGAVVGVGGLIFPRALGVGYDTIASLLQGDVSGRIILGILLVKSTIWAVSLGSGTSGGVLAPLLMVGGALGGLEARILPSEGVGFWPLISMAGVLAGALGAPLTGVLFAFELTHNAAALLPLLVACLAAHAFTALVLPRSILTEKLSRRGYHLSREYTVDPMEALAVRDVMRTNITVLEAETTLADLQTALQRNSTARGQRLYPVLRSQKLAGVVTRADLAAWFCEPKNMQRQLSELITERIEVTFADDPLRLVVNRMASTGFTRLPVVDRRQPDVLVGLIAIDDLLKARVANLDEEERRERVLHLRTIFRFRAAPPDVVS